MSNDNKTESSSNPESSDPQSTRIGKFIQTYHGFLSSFVIGAAGLIATTIWQYRQADVTARQAETQQQVAHTQAANSWKIEKANILAKKLEGLLAPGSWHVEQPDT